jgi:hypothetical protein
VHELPLYSSGLPGALENWLKLAGVPVATYSPKCLRTSSEGESSARMLLYDSRNSEACADARAAHEHGVRVLDTSAIWESGAIPLNTSRNQRLSRSRVLERLKTEIERLGGTWLRIADFPFPYQSAACFGTEGAEQHVRRLVAAFEPVPARFAATIPVACHRVSDSTYVVDRTVEQHLSSAETPAGNDVETWIRRRYAQGLPLAVPGAAPAIESDIPFDAGLYPLLWRTNFEEFANWWRCRAKISFRAHCRGQILQIECDDEPCEFPPMLELWRGQHVASFPLHPGSMTVREDGLVFMQEHHRHPAGFAPQWAEFDRSSLLEVKPRPRSA